VRPTGGCVARGITALTVASGKDSFRPRPGALSSSGSRREPSADDFDLDRIFAKEGAEIVHLSELIAALPPKTCQFCLDIARIAKENGSLISFDLNPRASFWKGREKELSAAFAEIASRSDILIGNEEDFQLCRGIKDSEAGGKGLDDKIGSFKEMIGRVRKAYPNAPWFGTTLREVISANSHMWGALATDGREREIIKPREIGVIDRIGGGDGFVGGMFYGILKGWDVKKCARFGWVGGALAATMLTDYAQPADEDQLWSIWNGSARVKR
jgi:2-dehydro-3-deoxygluconokinase